MLVPVGLELAKEETEPVELTDTERSDILEFFGKLDKKMLMSVFESISQMVRAFDGRSIDAEDIITRLTNVKNILERSRFPTYPLLAKQVYLRLIKKYNPQAQACEDWADLEAQALISYKGLSREEYTEQLKSAAAPANTQQFMFSGPRQEQEVKRRFYQRKAKPEQTEFVNQ